MVVARERARRAGDREVAVAERNSIVPASERVSEEELHQDRYLKVARL